MRNLHIISAADGSIGEITNNLIPFLKEHFNITIEGEDAPKELDILLSHFLQPEINRAGIDRFKVKILIQPIDGTVILPEYVEMINQYDLIITPGFAGKRILEENNVIKPVVVIPNFYKEEEVESIIVSAISQVMELEKQLENKFVFYHESTHHPRKGIRELYLAFAREFVRESPQQREAILVVKDIDHNKLTHFELEDIKEEVIALQEKQLKKGLIPAKIIKISQKLDFNLLQYLWVKANAYVSFSYFEGFGIPILRFAAMDKPIIATKSNKQGYMDFLSDNNSYLVDTNEILADKEFMWLYDKTQTKWNIPTSIIECQWAMRDCFNDYYNSRRRTKINTDRFKLENVAKQYINELFKVINQK